MSKINRRRFCQSLAGTSLLSRASLTSTDLLQATVAAPDSPHIGNLYPFVQKQADRSPLELSFLQSRFRDLKSWQDVARASSRPIVLFAGNRITRRRGDPPHRS